MNATVIRLHADADDTAERSLVAFGQYLDRCALAANTIRAYRRQATAYLAWWAEHRGQHPDAFADTIGAQAAVTAWRRHLLDAGRAKPASVNQALAAVTLLYDQICHLPITVKHAQVPKPGAPDALTTTAEGALRRAADRRGPRDAAIIALLLGSGARVEECARLTVTDLAITPRTGTVRLFGKGDQTRTVPLPAPARERLTAWLHTRAALVAGRTDPGRLWLGQRGPLGSDGITKVVLAVGTDARIPGLRPHRLRHTYATRLREGGADPAQIQRLMGHASIETTARYFRASDTEVAALVDRLLDY